MDEGARWGSDGSNSGNGKKVITWSLETDGSDNAVQQAAGQRTAQDAIATWAAQSGLAFEEVGTDANANIRIDWETLNIATHGRGGLHHDRGKKRADQRQQHALDRGAQSVKNADTAAQKGYDAGKKVPGIKRHIGSGQSVKACRTPWRSPPPK